MHTNALLQLLRLCSPALPIGSYAYSQGLESACEQSWVHDPDSLESWISGVLKTSLKQLDVPIFSRLYDAHQNSDTESFNYWNQYLLASRETKELFLEDIQVGQALIRLLKDLDITNAQDWLAKDTSLANAFCLACIHWQIDKEQAVQGFLWTWCENQVSIGIKLIPLGQTSGQKILTKLSSLIVSVTEQGLQLKDDQLGASSPGLVIASMQHEDQYSRLFRS